MSSNDTALCLAAPIRPLSQSKLDYFVANQAAALQGLQAVGAGRPILQGQLPIVLPRPAIELPLSQESPTAVE